MRRVVLVPWDGGERPELVRRRLEVTHGAPDACLLFRDAPFRPSGHVMTSDLLQQEPRWPGAMHVHGESLAQIASDPERSVLIGGVTSVTLSAGEAAKRADKERQVSRRCQSTVFGTAVELRSFGEWIIHRDLEKAVDAYLDYAPFGASWRKRSSADDGVLERVICAPLVGVRQRGSIGSFGYAALKKGEELGEELG